MGFWRSRLVVKVPEHVEDSSAPTFANSNIHVALELRPHPPLQPRATNSNTPLWPLPENGAWSCIHAASSSWAELHLKTRRAHHVEAVPTSGRSHLCHTPAGSTHLARRPRPPLRRPARQQPSFTESLSTEVSNFPLTKGSEVLLLINQNQC